MKRGFTLVEILGVIVLIAILALIVTPAVTTMIKGSEEETYELQLKSLKESLKTWGAGNVFNLPLTEGGKMEVPLGCLKTGGYLDVKFQNPKDDSCFCNSMKLSITKKQTSYLYSIDTEEFIKSNENDKCNTKKGTCDVTGTLTAILKESDKPDKTFVCN